MMKKILFALLCVVPMCALSAVVEQGSCWTDGMVMLRAREVNNGVATLMGGTLHEGGYQFRLVAADGGDDYVVRPAEGESDEFCSFGGTTRNGDHVTIEEVGGTRLLVARHTDGTITYVYQEYNESLRDLMIRDLRMTYAGTYVDAQGGQWVFTLDGKLQRPGMAAAQPYTNMDIFEMPSEVIKTNPGEYLEIRPSTTGLNVYRCQFDEEIEVFDSQQTKPVAKLRRTGSPWASAGIFPYTSEVLLMPTMASLYDNRALRLMRNEIWARHGYQFSSSDLQCHFGQQPWYTPCATGNSGIALSPIEQMNVDIIRSIELIPNRDWVVTEAGL